MITSTETPQDHLNTAEGSIIAGLSRDGWDGGFGGQAVVDRLRAMEHHQCARGPAALYLDQR